METIDVFLGASHLEGAINSIVQRKLAAYEAAHGGLKSEEPPFSRWMYKRGDIFRYCTEETISDIRDEVLSLSQSFEDPLLFFRALEHLVLSMGGMVIQENHEACMTDVYSILIDSCKCSEEFEISDEIANTIHDFLSSSELKHIPYRMFWNNISTGDFMDHASCVDLYHMMKTSVDLGCARVGKQPWEALMALESEHILLAGHVERMRLFEMFVFNFYKGLLYLEAKASQEQPQQSEVHIAVDNVRTTIGSTYATLFVM